MTMKKSTARSQRYQDKAIRRYSLKINRFTEPEVLEHLEKQENLQGYLKELILKDMEGEKDEARSGEVC